MKYGRLVFTRMLVSPTLCNAGDIAQSMAVDLIYRRMNIPESQIVDIGVEELGSYRGEKVILPINGYFLYSAGCPAFPTSPDIVPVFLGVYNTSRQYLRHREYWSHCGPIGCRDEATRQAMRKRGYPAYLLGCMTLTLPRRTREPEHPKVFLVDAHPGILPYLPQQLKTSLVRLTHDIPVDASASLAQQRAEMQRKTQEIYRRYREEAGLVITSRLHCAAPCIAMGIPVIVVKDSYDERFGWLDKLVHLYTPDEYDQIDWNPQPLELEEHKERLFRAAKSLILQAPDWELLGQIDAFYMNRTRKPLRTPVFVRGYQWLAQYHPALASFLRTKVLYRFTITASNRN